MTKNDAYEKLQKEGEPPAPVDVSHNYVPSAPHEPICPPYTQNPDCQPLDELPSPRPKRTCYNVTANGQELW
eukprot:CAMPEP_0201520902 /NCGR_PEP_ID=MMETSP0161_2-20130828/13158_1 /ASSEMBLY_ACC=CAM_ASM_000251 /TAXON_ID=180227 /ORGANISM="Neoparamoeba aestuarina, Strain SoJaBio B1-5/56/2" /LENGTH=71 /DNA_ID=CAMNT_0047919417 /DNA_START=93 /DNA_END=305 /DNA_ORIENTATION=+